MRICRQTGLAVKVSFKALKMKEKNMIKFCGYITTAIFEEIGIDEERKQKKMCISFL